MIKLKEILEGKKSFVGTCVSGLDDPNFTSRICSDATEMAQMIDVGTKIDFSNFLNMTNLWPQAVKKFQSGNYTFAYNKDRDVVWAYDEDKDVHYFFA